MRSRLVFHRGPLDGVRRRLNPRSSDLQLNDQFEEESKNNYGTFHEYKVCFIDVVEEVITFGGANQLMTIQDYHAVFIETVAKGSRQQAQGGNSLYE